MKLQALAVLAALAALAVGGVVLYRYRDKFNPLSQNNLAFTGANAVVTSVLGREESVGTAAYEAVSDNPLARGWRWVTGTRSTDDVNYSGPVSAEEAQMVKDKKAAARYALPGDL